ncbi:unnamed protein product, partial [marine sediment metagenome]
QKEPYLILKNAGPVNLLLSVEAAALILLFLYTKTTANQYVKDTRKFWIHS